METSRCSKSLILPIIPQLTSPVINIHSSIIPTISTQFNLTTDFPSQENLTTSNAFSSFSPSTATILPQEFNSFTTDSQTPWLPNSNSSSLPAQSLNQPSNQYPLNNTVHQDPSQQDFVLFETRTQNVRRTPSLTTTSTFPGQNRRHSSHLASASPLPQNQRVAAIIQSTGHTTSTSAFSNRFNSSAQLVQNQHQYPHLYASAPASPATLRQPQRPRPQVPLFSQSTGSVPRTPNMAFQGNSINAHSHAPFHNDSHLHADMDLFDEFTAFEGGASTQNSYSSAFSSPAVATMYDPTNNLSSSSSINMGTVSPQDLSLRDSFASAPNSAAFTNLTSPSTFNESPNFDDYEISPFVTNDGINNVDLAMGDPWFSLFPDQKNAPQQIVEQSNIDHSPLVVEEELDIAEQVASEKKGNRRKTGSAASATSPASATSGIRKRPKVLPPIIVEDPTNNAAMKRARNTLAARKSRQRKMQRVEELEDKCAKLEIERDHWKQIALKRNVGL
ncbi:General control protein [Ciborinia camelliae]|nr:General control protein [Ciborinia camelliae]